MSLYGVVHFFCEVRQDWCHDRCHSAQNLCDNEYEGFSEESHAGLFEHCCDGSSFWAVEIVCVQAVLGDVKVE